jgi:hypothetical protein
MHKGRIVPHHPSWFVGENYFWPSYISWKLMLSELQSYRFPDFPNYAPPAPTVSDGGVRIDEHEIYWEWSVDWTILCDRIRITMSDDVLSGDRATRFHAEMFLGLVLVDQCYWYEFGGVFVWNNASFTAYKTPVVDPFTPWGFAQIFQATYAQGGDPFS